MKARVSIDFACNDPDNGIFDHRVAMIRYGEIELEADDWNGYAFLVQHGFIRLHRRKFRIVGGTDWHGNWCWNRYFMQRAEAKRFILMLRASGRWRCTCGPSRWYAWFNVRAAVVRQQRRAKAVQACAVQTADAAPDLLTRAGR